MTASLKNGEELAWSPGCHSPALDGVRGFAILIVTVYRLCKELDPTSHPLIGTIRRFSPIGERGVDLFFVLSGFLITGILLQSKGKPYYFRNFMVRRALRIFPLYFLSLLVGLWMIPTFVSTDSFDLPRKEQFYLWTYTSNLRMSWLNEWCFGPFDHFWSLAVEEHFYLVWPAFVLLLSRKQLAMVCVGAIGAVAILRTWVAMDPSFDIAIDVHTIFRADALAMGGLLAILLTSSVPPRQIRRVSVWTGLMTFPLLAGIAVTGKRLLGVPNTLCPIFLMAAMAYLLLSTRDRLSVRAIESRPLRFLGKYSYGMYVVQLPLVTMFPLSAWTDWLPSDAIVRSIFYIGGMFGLITLIAFLSFHLLESHFLKLKKSFQ